MYSYFRSYFQFLDPLRVQVFAGVEYAVDQYVASHYVKVAT